MGGRQVDSIRKVSDPFEEAEGGGEKLYTAARLCCARVQYLVV